MPRPKWKGFFHIELAVYDLEGGLEEIEDHLAICDRVFRRFKAKRRREEESFESRHRGMDKDGVKESLPFDEHPGSCAEPSSLV